MEVDIVQMAQVRLIARLIPKTSPSKDEVTASENFTVLGAPDIKRGLLPLSCQPGNCESHRHGSISVLLDHPPDMLSASYIRLCSCPNRSPNTIDVSSELRALWNIGILKMQHR